MVTPVEVGLVVLVIVALLGVFRLIRAVRPLVINAVVGLLVLFGAGFVGFGVKVTPVVVLLVAFGGLPAAILVIILAQVDVVFEAAAVLL